MPKAFVFYDSFKAGAREQYSVWSNAVVLVLLVCECYGKFAFHLKMCLHTKSFLYLFQGFQASFKFLLQD